MKKIASVLTFLFCLVLFSPVFVFSQGTVSGSGGADWIRVQSDNGEFSIEVPAIHGFFRDAEGFLLTDSMDSYQLREMNMLNAFHEKTLLSFESYKVGNPKAVARMLQNRERKNGKLTQISRNGSAVEIKQISLKIEKVFAVQQFITSKNHLYILTAAARDGETQTAKRFLDSLIFEPEIKTSPSSPPATGLKIVRFSELKQSLIELDRNPEPYKKPDTSKNAAAAKGKDSLPVAVITKPRPSFTDAARQRREEGIIQIRVTFSEEGRITKVGFLKTLREGLLREATLAALRMKFLPGEKDGKPQTL